MSRLRYKSPSGPGAGGAQAPSPELLYNHPTRSFPGPHLSPNSSTTTPYYPCYHRTPLQSSPTTTAHIASRAVSTAVAAPEVRFITSPSAVAADRSSPRIHLQPAINAVAPKASASDQTWKIYVAPVPPWVSVSPTPFVSAVPVAHRLLCRAP